jgi:7-dehydrocholesterol reductase
MSAVKSPKTPKSASKSPAAKGKAAANGDWSGGDGLIPGREALGPILLMAASPCFAMIFFHVCSELHGNFLEFGATCVKGGFFSTLYSIWPTPWDGAVWKMIGTFMGFQLFLQRFAPGKRFEATLTPNGNRPVYKANGMISYLITLAFLLLSAYTGVFNPATIYDNFGKILSSMNVFAWAFCLMLCVKGYVAPSTTDSGTTGSLIQDFYWGMELYPNIFGFDVTFTNCRGGMMFWAVAVVSFCFTEYGIARRAVADWHSCFGRLQRFTLANSFIGNGIHVQYGYSTIVRDITFAGAVWWVPSVHESKPFLDGVGARLVVLDCRTHFCRGFLLHLEQLRFRPTAIPLSSERWKVHHLGTFSQYDCGQVRIQRSHQDIAALGRWLVEDFSSLSLRARDSRELFLVRVGHGYRHYRALLLRLLSDHFVDGPCLP